MTTTTRTLTLVAAIGAASDERRSVHQRGAAVHAASTKSVREKLAHGGGREIVDAVCLQRFDDLRAAESGFAADGAQAKIS